jgi:hypothetical protein
MVGWSRCASCAAASVCVAAVLKPELDLLDRQGQGGCELSQAGRSWVGILVEGVVEDAQLIGGAAGTLGHADKGAGLSQRLAAVLEPLTDLRAVDAELGREAGLGRDAGVRVARELAAQRGLLVGGGAPARRRVRRHRGSA